MPRISSIQNSNDLDQFLIAHQEYLSGDAIVPIVESIPKHFANDSRAQFLRAVVFYHQQHKAGKDAQWGDAYDHFNRVDTVGAGAYLRFFVHNYRFLCARNANFGPSILSGSYDKAKAAAEEVQEPRRCQLLGFLLYNEARLLLTQDLQVQALETWQLAATNRIRWYLEQRNCSADPDTLKAAATQVWKMRKDFHEEGFFPGMPIDYSGVSIELFTEVSKIADPNFSAAKSS